MHSNVMLRFMVQALQDSPLCSSTTQTSTIIPDKQVESCYFSIIWHIFGIGTVYAWILVPSKQNHLVWDVNIRRPAWTYIRLDCLQYELQQQGYSIFWSVFAAYLPASYITWNLHKTVENDVPYDVHHEVTSMNEEEKPNIVMYATFWKVKYGCDD